MGGFVFDAFEGIIFSHHHQEVHDCLRAWKYLVATSVIGLGRPTPRATLRPLALQSLLVGSIYMLKHENLKKIHSTPLLHEQSLARLGADVTGIDPSRENVAVASAHAQGDPLTRSICYEAATADELDARGNVCSGGEKLCGHFHFPM